MFLDVAERLDGGGRGIRTPVTLAGKAVFKTACFNHSHIPPRGDGFISYLQDTSTTAPTEGRIAFPQTDRRPHGRIHHEAIQDKPEYNAHSI